MNKRQKKRQQAKRQKELIEEMKSNPNAALPTKELRRKRNDNVFQRYVETL